ncbi:MAG: tRNA (guanosine(37)-N1)-methyltransferase TrmD [Gammaproteobacteria bacterium]|nr:tRNA (guanosine(37)-N1)-methyltransferase TrmD [Gammaproteobacteria bacterium]
MHIGVVTLFPQMFEAVTEYGITGRAIKAERVKLNYWNPRDFTTDKHRTVDDKPFGGGPGMLMKTEPLQLAIRAARQSLEVAGGNNDLASNDLTKSNARAKVIYLSPQGKKLEQSGIEQLSCSSALVMVCGRYQGIDERLLEAEIDEEWSLGDFVISGGELAAMVLIDALTRLQPGALGGEDSAGLDSFSQGLLHCPQYTRPQTVADMIVPEALLSGDHERIRVWRLKQSLGTTWKKRPDLLKKMNLNAEQRTLLEEFINEYKTTQAGSSAE